ncbi:MAG: FAD:protein transferase [Actinomycetota bacterium]|jgi:thiamine biosynthesis lipoprotein
MTREAHFRAMGSDAHVVVVGGRADALDRARSHIDALEQRWSRFLPTSEVSALNALAGAAVQVSDDTALLVRTALAAIRLTGGSFDPTVLGAMVRAGYDRSFDELARTPVHTSRCGLVLGADGIEIDGNVVRLPEGVGFDPGGIGKGLAADLVAHVALDDGVAGIAVNLGGDVRVAGESSSGGGWTIAIDHPWSREPIVHVGLVDGAVATSTTLLRAWTLGGTPRHHVIDPATGAPSTTDLTLASVVSAAGWTSEVLAKAVLLRGAAHPFDLLGGTPCDALAVGRDGRVQTTAGFERFTGGRAPTDVIPSQEVFA